MTTLRTTIVIDATSRSALRALSREFERITAYDGSTIQITFENAVPSLPPLIRAPGALQDAVSGALSAADAAASSWYRKGPVGKPYDVRIRAASQTLRSEFDSMYRSLSVFVKVVVRRFHAASLISGALISVSGLSQTGPAGCQLRVLPDQRCGFCARAFA